MAALLRSMMLWPGCWEGVLLLGDPTPDPPAPTELPAGVQAGQGRASALWLCWLRRLQGTLSVGHAAQAPPWPSHFVPTLPAGSTGQGSHQDPVGLT